VKHLTKRVQEVRKVATDLHDDDDGAGQHITLRTDVNTALVEELILEKRLCDSVSPIPQRESRNRCFLINSNAKAHSLYRCKILKLGKRREACTAIVV